MTSRLKQWAVAHPVAGTLAVALCWYAVLVAARPLGVEAAALAAAVPAVGVVLAFGWWREAGVRWRPPDRRWLPVLPVLAACAALPALRVAVPGAPAAGGPLAAGAPAAVAVALSVELAGRGLGQYAVRRLWTWRSSLLVAALYGPADLAVGGGPALPRLACGVALGWCLMGLRWRLPTVWPLVPVHAAALLGGPLPWWPVVAAGLAGYGAVLLRRVPTVLMAARPTVRVLCLDQRGRALLLRWHDPFDGTWAWDLPGGGIDPGERPVDAARRELCEETGLPGSCVLEHHLQVPRNSYWNGTRYLGTEPVHLARVGRPGPLSRQGLEPTEAALMRGYRWVDPAAATRLPGRVQAADRLAATAHALQEHLR